MLEMLCFEHQLVIYKEIKARFREFEQLDERGKIGGSHKRTTPGEYEGEIVRKTRAQVKSYLEKSKKEKALKMCSLSTEPDHSGQ